MKSSKVRFVLSIVFVSSLFVLGWANGGQCGQEGEGGLSLCADCRELESFIKQVAIEDMERDAWNNYDDTADNSYDDDDFDDSDGCGGDSDGGGDAGSFGCGCTGCFSGGDGGGGGGSFGCGGSSEGSKGDDDDDDDTDDDIIDDDSGDDDDGQDFSGTNVQEEGVDEADLSKTDGNYLYYLTDYGSSDSRVLVFKVWPPDETDALIDVELEGKKIGIFLYQNWVLALTSLDIYSLGDDVWLGRDRSRMCEHVLKMTLIDVSNPANPVIEREVYVEGEYVGSRRIEGSARIVVYRYPTSLSLQTYIDPWDYYSDGRLDKEALKEAYRELIEKNKQIIWQTPLDVFLSHYYDIVRAKGEIRDGVLSNCYDTYTPNRHFGFGILSVITVFFDEATVKQNDISVVCEGSLVYASKENLFVAGNSILGRSWGDPDRSEVHMFDIHTDATQAIYLASGWVEGWALNQFSMSEYEGFLRIATTKWNGRDEEWWGGIHGVMVLERDGQSLVTIGRLTNIAPSEELYAVRFLGIRGFIVTFDSIVQIDPLFTIDLADPYHPRLVGELEIPGFSNYIHPMGANHLLTIGENGNWEGDTWGVALNIFDVSDFDNPMLIHQEEVGGYDASSPAQQDHHALLYYKEMLSIPLVTGDYNDEWKGGGGEKSGVCGFYVYRATPEQGFVMRGVINHAGDYSNEPTRSAVIEDYLYTLSSFKLVVIDIESFGEVADIEF